MYTKLYQLGDSVSHPTVAKLVRMGAKDHDRKVKLWQDNWTRVLQCTPTVPEDSRGTSSSHVNASCNPQVVAPCSFVIVGDNLDKNVKPRDMRVDYQVQSLHYFNSYAALDRLDVSGLSTETLANSPDGIMAIPTCSHHCGETTALQVPEYLHTKHLSQSLSRNMQKVGNGAFL